MTQTAIPQQMLTFDDLKRYAQQSGVPHVASKDFLMTRLDSSNAEKKLPASFKIDCLSIFFCSDGEAAINLNFNTVHLCAGSLLVLSPDKLIELAGDSGASMQCYALFLSKEFLNLLTLDSNTMDFSNVQLEAPPVMQLSESQAKLMLRYFELLHLSSENNPDDDIYAVNILRSLTSALIYQMMRYRNQQNESETADAADRQQKVARKNFYVRDFMKLVSLHFREQRSVNFYADKLFISAKYLSLIIKESTGYTATEWIDHYVILEAKNLLRFSGRNIQQIAYDLNFHNQSSFGKYFKHQTGLSPSQFRKS